MLKGGFQYNKKLCFIGISVNFLLIFIIDVKCKHQHIAVNLSTSEYV